MEPKLVCYNINRGNVGEVELAMSEYINHLCFPENFKKQIRNMDFYKNNPAYYINYPYLFLKGPSKDGNIVKLCIAGALYYQSIIYIDRVLDKDVSLSNVFPIISICTEETVKILSSFIPIESDFWKIWNKRKLEFLKAFHDDRKGGISTDKEFLLHSDCKAAFGKLAIDALFYMNHIDEKEYEAYLQIHKYFYGAFQILDDISDIREDYNKGQYNIAIATVYKNQNERKQLCDGEAISEFFYTERLYEKLYELAGNWVVKARIIASQNGLNYMVEECNKLWNTIVIQQRNINTYLYQLNVTDTLSREKIIGNSIKNVCNSALEFLEKHQDSDGCWVDICNNAGASDSWCTAFVTIMLENNEQAAPLIKKSKDYLRKCLQSDMWGYSHLWICDNDSSCMALLATEEYRYIDKIVRRFNPDGGVPTYFDDNQLLSSLLCNHHWNGNIDGWRQSHPDVSAIALYMLSKASYSGLEKKCLLSYFKNRISNNLPMVYWWIDDIYTLFFLSLANSLMRDRDLDAYIKYKTTCKLKRFVETTNKESLTVFFISMLLHLLLYCGKINDANQVALVLKDLQYADGSWPESNFMCMPAADCVIPNNTSLWDVRDHGINVRAHEFHRVFTTSLALMALSEYLSYEK